MLKQFNCYNSANNFVSLQNFSKRIPSKCAYCFNGEAFMKKGRTMGKRPFFNERPLSKWLFQLFGFCKIIPRRSTFGVVSLVFWQLYRKARPFYTWLKTICRYKTLQSFGYSGQVKNEWQDYESSETAVRRGIPFLCRKNLLWMLSSL